MIHVCYGLYDKTGRYSKFTGTSMLSLFENVTPPRQITIHILHDNTLSQDNRDKLISIAENYNQQIKFYNVEKTHAREMDDIRKNFSEWSLKRISIGSLFRLFLPEIVSNDIERIIYLDSDIIVNLDINELWQIDLGDKPFGAVPRRFNGSMLNRKLPIPFLSSMAVVNIEDYFNSGVLLMNLRKLHDEKQTIMEGIKWAESHSQNIVPIDQEVLNYCFSKNYLELPVKFNFYVPFQREIKVREIKSVIYHYLSWSNGLDMHDVYNRLFFEYFAKTPWFNEDTIGNIYDDFRQIYNENKTLMIEVSKMMANKERAFFTEHVSVKHVKKTFLITDEEIISTEENENLQDDIDAFTDSNKIQGALEKFLNSMKKSHGKKVYFLLVSGYYPKLCEILQSQGFEENKNFINGDLFRSESSGEPLNTYPIVKNM